MSELSEAISEMRNMRESYDQLAATADLYQQGRTELAQAISLKGVQTASTDSLQTMAEKVGQIAQTPIVYNDGEIYAKQICGEGSQWDLYTKTADIWNTYRNEYGAIMMALYFKGYASIDLDTAAADSYITSDGCYYHYLNGNWVKEKNGTIEVVTLDNTTIHHYWDDDDDGYMDRFVAYMFYSAGRDYTVPSTNLCPRAIFYAGVLGTINCTVAGRIREIVKIGEESYFQGVNFTNTQQWGQVLNIRGSKKHTIGNVIYNSNTVALYYDEVEEISSPLIGGSDSSTAELYSIYLASKGKILQGGKINTNKVAKNIATLYCCVKSVTHGSENYSGAIFTCAKDNAIMNFPYITEFVRDSVVSIQGEILYTGIGGRVIAPLLTRIQKGNGIITASNNGSPTDCKVKEIYTPSFISGGILATSYNTYSSLIDLWVGEYVGNLNLSSWTATGLTSAEDIATLNANIRNHIAARLADGNSTQTITFGANLFNNLEQATIDAFDEKHWLIASA